MTGQIKATVAELGEAIIQAPAPRTKFEQPDVKPGYLKRLAELVDLKAIKKANLKVVSDPFCGLGGSSKNYLPRLVPFIL